MAIWSKGGDTTNDLVHEFTVGDDYLWDRHLAPYDILGSLAHASMLAKVGLLPNNDADVLLQGLRELHDSFQQDEWTVEASDEDVHSKVEALLTEKIGDAAKRLHTGRSRNDQVLTDVRLWMKDHLCSAVNGVLNTVDAMLERAKTYEFHPLPGYTHLQRGMPSSVGLFFASHAAALLQNLALFEAAWSMSDNCPLGSGASYGVGLPLDRAYSAELLGFGNSGAPAMADANGRGKVECAMIDAFGAVINDCSRFAADMVFFTSAEAGFFRIGAGFTTGSSIMPQKKNLDLFELLRGRSARFLGLRTGLYASTLGLYSGYSRDLQDTKALLINGCQLGDQALALLQNAVPTLEPVREKIQAALTPDLYATDEAYRLVTEEGMTFRDAYVQVGQNLDKVQTPDHDATLKMRTHAGSTGNIGIEQLQKRMQKLRDDWEKRSTFLQETWTQLLND